MPAWARTRTSSKIMPIVVVRNPAMISHRWGYRRASRPAAAEAARIPMVAGVSISPVWIGL